MAKKKTHSLRTLTFKLDISYNRYLASLWWKRRNPYGESEAVWSLRRYRFPRCVRMSRRHTALNRFYVSVSLTHCALVHYTTGHDRTIVESSSTCFAYQSVMHIIPIVERSFNSIAVSRYSLHIYELVIC